MGLNTRHDVINDKAPGYNITRKSSFRFEVLSAVEARKIEVAQNFSMFQIKMAIKINGVADINLSDKVRVLGNTYKVASIDSTYDNPELFKIRGDVENFTGDTIVGLE